MTRGSPACLPPRSDPRPTVETSNGTIAVTAPRGQLSLVSSNARIGIAATDAAVRASSANGEIAFAGSLATGRSRSGPRTRRLRSTWGPMRRSAWTSRPRTRRWPSATRSRPARRPHPARRAGWRRACDRQLGADQRRRDHDPSGEGGAGGQPDGILRASPTADAELHRLRMSRSPCSRPPARLHSPGGRSSASSSGTRGSAASWTRRRAADRPRR
jgi:hypothetical protein